MTKKVWKIITLSLCGVILCGAVAWAGVSLGMTTNALGQYKNQLEYVYERNLYELTDNINNIESNLAKLKNATATDVQERYLGSIVALANTAQDNIATLPIEHNAINDTIKFVNQLSGYGLVLQQKLVKNETLSMDDMEQIAGLHTSSQNIKYELNRLAVMISGGYSIVDNIADPNSGTSRFNGEFGGLNNEIVDYPQLIYDGPFSDSTTDKEIKGLPQNEINSEEALNKIKEWFPDFSAKMTGSAKGGSFDTFDFMLTKGEQEYYAQVSVRGGILIQLNGAYDAGDAVKTEDECRTIATTFAQNLGFTGMQAVWSTTSQGFCYLNLVCVTQNVAIYPDMIKVKIALDTGMIVGWEAKSWAYNHTERKNLTAKISESTARFAVTTDMDIRASRLCVIPNEYVGETLCYEFLCVQDGATYYVYVDATSGKQVNLLKVIETDDGNLLM